MERTNTQSMIMTRTLANARTAVPNVPYSVEKHYAAIIEFMACVNRLGSSMQAHKAVTWLKDENELPVACNRLEDLNIPREH